jgi:hypothetical protein
MLYFLEDIAMKYYRMFGVLLLLLIFCTPAAGYDLQQGVHGMKWGSFISQYDNLTKVHQVNQVTYYANSNMIYQTALQPVPAVFYGFYRDKFFAVFIKLSSPNQFVQLQRDFTKKHGKPRTTRDAAAGQTVYRWKQGDVKIKLKIKESSGDYKMAFYYVPLAAKLNIEQLESLPPGIYDNDPPQKDGSVKTAPLLE